MKKLVEETKTKNYCGKGAPQIVLVSPIAVVTSTVAVLVSVGVIVSELASLIARVFMRIGTCIVPVLVSV